jgi:RHS repeat-associated protein
VGQRSATETIFQLTDLRGHVVAAVTGGEGAWIFGDFTTFDEYGAVTSGPKKQYGWHGAAGRQSGALGGLILMGARLYNPLSGRFLSPDAIVGGNDNSYTYSVDPINLHDLTGLATKWIFNKKIKPKNAVKWAKRIKNVKRWTDIVTDNLKYISRVPNWGTVVKIVVELTMAIAGDIADSLLRGAKAPPPRGYYLQHIRVKVGIVNLGYKVWKIRAKWRVEPKYKPGNRGTIS